jgi:hypothetical protein
MRYIIKPERERARKREQERAERRHWMTLVEAIKYLKDRWHLDERQAVEALFSAIIDGFVKALWGDISYEDDSLAAYDRLSPSDLQREVKICLEGPGYIDLDSNSRTESFEYPKILMVAGPIGEIIFDKSDPYTPPLMPKVDAQEYGPVLVSHDDMQNFAPEEETDHVTSVSAAVSSEVLNQTTIPSGPNHLPFEKTRSRHHRRDATREAILAVFPHGLPSGVMVRERDNRINTWLTENGLERVSSKTISRSFSDLRRDRS